MGKTLKVLNQMVADGIVGQYAIGGAVSALNYIEPTVTEHIDVLISFSQVPASDLVTLGPIVGYLATKGYTTWEKEGLVIEGWPVQFLPVADSLDLEAIEQAEAIEDVFGTDGLVATRVLSAAHVVATALRTGRPKDFLRINAFIEEGAVDLDRLKAVISSRGLGARWAAFCRKAGREDPLEPVCRP
jgi:hypothetical protein